MSQLYHLHGQFNFSGMVFHYFLKDKSEASQVLKQFLADISPFGIVKSIRSNQGGEFAESEFKEVTIKHEVSAPHTSHEKGVAERFWRTVFDRCHLIKSGLPKKVWTDAVATAWYVQNRCYKNSPTVHPVHPK